MHVTHFNAVMWDSEGAASDPRQLCPDIALTREVLRWQPRVAPRDGLRKTIE